MRKAVYALAGVLGLLVMLAALALSSGAGEGGIVPEPPINSLVAVPVTETQTKVVGIVIDDTTSLIGEVRSVGAENILRQLPGLIGKYGAGAVKIIHFGDRGWIGYPEYVNLPRRREVQCREAQVSKEVGVFKPFVAHKKKQAEDDCVRRQDDEKRAYDEQFLNAMQAIRSSLNATPHGEARCTAFYDALASIAASKQQGLYIMLSDASETCSKTPASLAAPLPGVNVVVLLLPSKYDLQQGKSVHRAFEDRKARLNEIAPWLRVENPTSEMIDGCCL